MEARAETLDATVARAHLGDLLARARYGSWRFVIQQRGEPAAVVMGYEDYQALMTLLEDLEDVRDMLESEGEPTRPLSAYLAERGKSSASV
jgi:prevent-host-death family protein